MTKSNRNAMQPTEELAWADQILSTDVDALLVEQERILLEFTEVISRLMDAKEVSKANLAREMGKSRAFVTKVLSGQSSPRLSTMASFFHALGSSMHVSFGPVTMEVKVPRCNKSRSARTEEFGGLGVTSTYTFQLCPDETPRSSVSPIDSIVA